MSEKTKRIKIPRGMRGMTLIEVLVAVTILSVSLISMAMLISTGLLQLQTMRVQRTASNCARMVMEFLETIPPDVVYTWSPGMAFGGDFSSGGVTQLNAFVNQNSDDTCKNLSSDSDPVGKKVQLEYSICPGCYSATQCDPDTLVCFSSCYYFYRVRLTYNGLALGGKRNEDYYTKKFHGTKYQCTDVNACGEGIIPGTLRDCNFPAN